MEIKTDGITLIAGEGSQRIEARFNTDKEGRVGDLRYLSIYSEVIENISDLRASWLARLGMMIAEADKSSSNGYASDTRSACIEHGFFLGYTCPACNPKVEKDVHPALTEVTSQEGYGLPDSESDDD